MGVRASFLEGVSGPFPSSFASLSLACSQSPSRLCRMFPGLPSAAPHTPPSGPGGRAPCWRRGAVHVATAALGLPEGSSHCFSGVSTALASWRPPQEEVGARLLPLFLGARRLRALRGADRARQLGVCVQLCP